MALHLRALGLSKSAIERVRTVLPTIDRVASADNVAAVLSYLQAELCLSKAGLGNLVGTYPQILGLSLEQNVRPTVEYVKGTLLPRVNAELEAARDRVLALLDGFYADGAYRR